MTIAGILLLILFVMMSVLLGFHLSPQPACGRCRMPMALLSDECSYAGQGWLVGARVYCCQSCGVTCEQAYVSSELD